MRQIASESPTTSWSIDGCKLLAQPIAEAIDVAFTIGACMSRSEGPEAFGYTPNVFLIAIFERADALVISLLVGAFFCGGP